MSDKGRRVVGEARATLTKELAERYAAGKSIRALASSIGRSYGFVHDLLTESGVDFRDRGGGYGGRSGSWTDEEVQKLRELAARGWINSRISRHLPGRNEAAVRSKLNALGIGGPRRCVIVGGGWSP